MRLKGNTDLASTEKVPGPGNYKPKMDFVEGRLTYGYSFGERIGSVIVSQNTVPGPGIYEAEIYKNVKQRNPSPVFGHEQRPGVEIKHNVKNPGPGTYVPGTDSTMTKSPKAQYPLMILIVLEKNHDQVWK